MDGAKDKTGANIYDNVGEGLGADLLQSKPGDIRDRNRARRGGDKAATTLLSMTPSSFS